MGTASCRMQLQGGRQAHCAYVGRSCGSSQPPEAHPQAAQQSCVHASTRTTTDGQLNGEKLHDAVVPHLPLLGLFPASERVPAQPLQLVEERLLRHWSQ